MFKPDYITLKTGLRMEDVERIFILETLRSTGYNRTRAADVLGIGIRTLQRKLNKFGLRGVGLQRKIEYDANVPLTQSA